MFVFILGFQAALAIHGMPDKIAADRAGDAIQSQWVKNHAHAPVNDHAASLTDRGKRFVNLRAQTSFAQTAWEAGQLP
jgi:23S rRNA maturation mini-RNase III